MKWVEPVFSKKRVKRAGESLINPACPEADKSEAMEVLSNWRASHAYPMHAILIFLRARATEIDEKAVVVQRLKRTPSILSKLQRYDKMKLHRMQDIGGCRAVVSNVNQAEKLASDITASRTRHELHKVDDYIKEPKDSGYRGIHLIYKYNGKKEPYKDFFIEIQVRSKIQHAWATAVEIVDTFTNQALKSSHGDKDWLDFFRNVSAEFAKFEKRPIDPELEGVDTKAKVKELSNKLSAVERFRAFAVTTDFIGKEKTNKSDYYILELEEYAKVIKVIHYTKDDFETAVAKYLELETRAAKEEEYDVVLVSAGSIHNLKAAYPNYFADSTEFLKLFSRVLTANMPVPRARTPRR